MTITWGANTTHTFGAAPATPGAAAAAAPPAFGAPATPGGAATPAPSTGFSFGAGTPGSTPAAPATGGAFSFASTPAAPATGGGLFGTSAPAPSAGGLFASGGSTPVPAAPLGGGLFGSPAPATGNLFGGSSTVGGAFGSTTAFGAAPGSIFGRPLQPQQPQVPQIPAQAALQAHMDASARQEEARVQQQLEQIHRAYTCTAPAKSSMQSSDFCEILYNPATPEYQQQQWLQGLGVGGGGGGDGQYQHPSRPPPILPPNKPPQVAQRAWEQAVVRNPDRQQYMPIAVVGATSLQARLTSQQEQVNLILKQLETLQKSHDVTQERYERARDRLKTMLQVQNAQQKRLMDIMRRVELARCYNNPLQPDEIKAMQKAAELYRKVDQLAHNLRIVEDQARSTTTVTTKQQQLQPAPSSSSDQLTTTVSSASTVDVPDKEQLKAILKEHRDELTKCTTMMDKDMRDLKLIARRVESSSKGSSSSLYGP